jgi:hypothetical protein
MGFYPTAINSIKKVIDKTIQFPENKEVFALDCCAGEGEAIEMLGLEYGCVTFAVELEKNRAVRATNRNIKKVLNADSLSGVRKSNGWVGLNFLNPPYGHTAIGERLELEFVQRWGLTTAVGGIMILVINPSSADEEMAKALRIQGYRPMFSYYDPQNEDYKKFAQFFVVLQKQLPNFRADVKKFINLFNNTVDINSDIEIEKLKIRTGTIPQLFKEIEVPRWKILNFLEKSKLKKSFFEELHTNGLSSGSIEQPNEGQSAILIAGGALNDTLTLNNGDKVILKGTSNKVKKEISTLSESGAVSGVKSIESFKTIIIGLNLTNGQFVKYE